MQDFLTISIELTAIASLAYFSTMLALGWSDRRRPATQAQIPTLAPEDEAIASELSDLWGSCIAEVEEAPAEISVSLSVISDTVVPFIRPAQRSVNWATLSPYDLRKACQSHGIRWRNADPKTGKHLKKAAMVKALSALALAA